MKKNIAIIILFFTFFNLAFSQANYKIQPKSFTSSFISNGNIPEIVLPTFSKADADQLDYSEAKDGHMPHYARHIAANITLDNAGSWTELSEGRIWRIKITSSGALGLSPLFENLYLPPGSYLHFYMPGHEEVLGAFTNYNTPEPRAFCPGLIHGESCIIEYFEPSPEKGKGILLIEKVSHAYRWVQPLSDGEKSGSQSCEVNVVCSPEGDNWRDQIRSVVRINIVDDMGQGFCSGTLTNNVRQDCTPYILSAQHCTEHGVSANQFNQWSFNFNYQASICSGNSGPLSMTINGCKKVADSQDNGAERGSDFLLLLLNSIPSAAWNVFYSGWDHTDNIPTSGVGIHHPEGDIKKISTYLAPAFSTTWGDTAQNTHWQLIWSPTTNGDGISEPGSSGSPMYNPAGRIVGHLTGGNSCCNVGGCTTGGSPTSPDLFGKLYFDWMLNGVIKNVQLGPWLDPDNTGASTLDGMNPPCGGTLANDAGILNITTGPDICQTTYTPVVVLKNYGDNALTKVTINYVYDNGSTTPYNWTGSLIPGGTINVTLPSVTLSPATHNLTVVTAMPNNHADADPSNDLANLTFDVSLSNAVNLFLSTDDAGTQTTWQITDGSSTIVASGGAYADYFGGEQFNIPICLPMGCYTFTILDAASNGMNAGESGNFVLTDGSGNPVYASLTTPAFGASESHTFCLVAAGIEEINTIPLSVIPNPSSGIFNLRTDNNEEKTIHVYDAVGRLILNLKTSEMNFPVNLSSNSSGIYILHIETADGTAVQKLVVR